jgi:hypothetical protein
MGALIDADPTGPVWAALAELRALRCADPAAARANETVRLTANTLEFFWLGELGSDRAAALPHPPRQNGRR